MFRIKTYNLLFFLFLLGINGVASQRKLLPVVRKNVEITIPKENFHLYLLIGQSNMAGRGTVEPEDTVGDKRILRLNRDGNWDIAKEPVHFDKKEAGVGPGLSFAREMLKGNDGITIGLIPCAAGGSGIDNWLQDTYWYQTESFPYNNALVRAKLAMQYGTLKGILWHQGEADCSTEKTKAYKEKLIKLAQKLRLELGIPDLAFVVGELPDFNSCAESFNPILYEVKQELSNFEVVSASSFTSLADGVHIDTKSQREFGQRYAGKLKLLFLGHNN